MVTTDTTPTSIFLLGLFLALVGVGLFLVTKTQFGRFLGGTLIWSGGLLALAGALAISTFVFSVFSVILMLGLWPASAIVGWCLYYGNINIDDTTWARQAFVLSILASALAMLVLGLNGLTWPQSFSLGVCVMFVELAASMVFTWGGKHIGHVMMLRRLRRSSYRRW